MIRDIAALLFLILGVFPIAFFVALTVAIGNSVLDWMFADGDSLFDYIAQGNTSAMFCLGLWFFLWNAGINILERDLN
tara:strand:+ start:1051 stop:1284 length:234 start_codon:yes stop_codon:yes gene_type:complete